MKSALITGASGGIGRGIAAHLAGLDYALTIASRQESALRNVAAELTAAGAADVTLAPVDMAARDALPSIVELHEKAYGSMHALVLAAGVGTSGPVGELPLHRFDKTMAVNIGAAFVLLKKALPLLRRGAAEDTDHGAKIIALASITGVYVEPGLAAYGASKAALISLIETLNAEESGGGVTATAIAPAYVDTNMSAWVQDRIPADSMIGVADVVEVAAMLLRLGRTASISRIVVSRSGTNGYAA